MKPILLAFLILFGVVSVSEAKEVVAKEGDPLFLPCIGEPGDTCVWTRSFPDGSSDVVAMSNGIITTPRYVLNDKPQLGDCSLNITSVQPSDISTLGCQIEPTNGVVVTYSVMVEGVVSVSEAKEVVAKEGDPLFLPCIGEPGNTCMWTRSFADGTADVVAMSNGIIMTPRYVLNDKPQLGDCSLNITAVESVDIAKLDCFIKPKSGAVVTYSVVVEEQSKISRVEIQSEWNEPPILGDTISCETTPSLPGITYRWFFKKHLDIFWNIIDGNKTIKLYHVGLYYCEATDDYIWVKSTNRIIVRNE